MPRESSARDSTTTVSNRPPLGWDELFEDRKLSYDSIEVFATVTKALAAGSALVAEVGCGRGALVRQDGREPWQDLRGEGRSVVGIDIDPVGAQNPVIDEFRLIADGRWPLDDASVDLAVCDFVLEHVADPDAFVAELTRVLRPGGAFVARTISRHSLLATAARLVPNPAHARVLRVLQPGREERDVFATAYRMNSARALGELFGERYDWAATWRPGLEQYFPRWPRLAHAVGFVERHLPRQMQMALVVCARKH